MAASAGIRQDDSFNICFTSEEFGNLERNIRFINDYLSFNEKTGFIRPAQCILDFDGTVLDQVSINEKVFFAVPQNIKTASVKRILEITATDSVEVKELAQLTYDDLRGMVRAATYLGAENFLICLVNNFALLCPKRSSEFVYILLEENAPILSTFCEVINRNYGTPFCWFSYYDVENTENLTEDDLKNIRQVLGNPTEIFFEQERFNDMRLSYSANFMENPIHTIIHQSPGMSYTLPLLASLPLTHFSLQLSLCYVCLNHLTPDDADLTFCCKNAIHSNCKPRYKMMNRCVICDSSYHRGIKGKKLMTLSPLGNHLRIEKRADFRDCDCTRNNIENTNIPCKAYITHRRILHFSRLEYETFVEEFNIFTFANLLQDILKFNWAFKSRGDYVIQLFRVMEKDIFYIRLLSNLGRFFSYHDN